MRHIEPSRAWLCIYCRCGITVTFVSLAVLGGHSLANEEERPTSRITPDGEMQAAITRVLNSASEAAFRDELERLRKADGPDYRRLIPQLVYYSLYGKDREGKHGIKEAMVAGVFIEHLAIRDVNVFNALVPYLDTEDAELRRALRGIFPLFENATNGRPPDFEMYTAFLNAKIRRHEQPNFGLVRYMYEREPGVALLSLMRALDVRNTNDLQSVVWAEHVAADTLWKQQHGFLREDQVEPAATEELKKLSRSEHWWARLYVAEIMPQHPAFREPEIIEQLTEDQHPLVRESITAIEPRE